MKPEQSQPNEELMQVTQPMSINQILQQIPVANPIIQQYAVTNHITQPDSVASLTVQEPFFLTNPISATNSVPNRNLFQPLCVANQLIPSQIFQPFLLNNQILQPSPDVNPIFQTFSVTNQIIQPNLMDNQINHSFLLTNPVNLELSVTSSEQPQYVMPNQNSQLDSVTNFIIKDESVVDKLTLPQKKTNESNPQEPIDNYCVQLETSTNHKPNMRKHDSQTLTLANHSIQLETLANGNAQSDTLANQNAPITKEANDFTHLKIVGNKILKTIKLKQKPIKVIYNNSTITSFISKKIKFDQYIESEEAQGKASNNKKTSSPLTIKNIQTRSTRSNVHSNIQCNAASTSHLCRNTSKKMADKITRASSQTGDVQSIGVNKLRSHGIKSKKIADKITRASSQAGDIQIGVSTFFTLGNKTKKMADKTPQTSSKYGGVKKTKCLLDKKVFSKDSAAKINELLGLQKNIKSKRAPGKTILTNGAVVHIPDLNLGLQRKINETLTTKLSFGMNLLLPSPSDSLCHNKDIETFAADDIVADTNADIDCDVNIDVADDDDSILHDTLDVADVDTDDGSSLSTNIVTVVAAHIGTIAARSVDLQGDKNVIESKKCDISIITVDDAAASVSEEELLEAEKSVDEHSDDKKVSKLTINANKTHKCDKCSKAYHTLRGLNIHLAFYKTKERPFTCDICQKNFTKKNVLARHKKLHEENDPSTCEHCQLVFATSLQLQRHLSTHSEQVNVKKEFICKVCNKVFNVRRYLQYHMKIHISENPFACEYCGKTFKVKGSLNKHLTTHFDHKPHECQICGRGFRLCGQLTQHVKEHAGLKPFQCPICIKKFTRAPYCRIHIRQHIVRAIDEEKKVCPVCEEEFEDLEEHVDSHMKTLVLST